MESSTAFVVPVVMLAGVDEKVAARLLNGVHTRQARIQQAMVVTGENLNASRIRNYRREPSKN